MKVSSFIWQNNSENNNNFKLPGYHWNLHFFQVFINFYQFSKFSWSDTFSKLFENLSGSGCPTIIRFQLIISISSSSLVRHILPKERILIEFEICLKLVNQNTTILSVDKTFTYWCLLIHVIVFFSSIGWLITDWYFVETRWVFVLHSLLFPYNMGSKLWIQYRPSWFYRLNVLSTS